MSVHTELFEDSVSYLKKSDGNGSNLYDHLSETLLRILEERPSDPVDKFEFLSTEVKRGAYTADAPHTSANVLQDNSPAVVWASSVDKLFEKVEPAPEGEEPTVANTEFELEDCMSQAAMLEWAGVSVGQEELYRLMLSMQKMCSNTKTIKAARFWGKILGKQADYYVMETTRAGAGEDAEPVDGETAEDTKEVPDEKEGEGCNFFVYYVCSYAGGDWVALPNVQPEQIVSARALRRFFTGDLDAKVRGYPPFPGGDAASEKNLLRAQIARITSGTSIAPAGFYSATGGGEEEESEEATAPQNMPMVDVNKKFGVEDPESGEDTIVTAKDLLDGEKWQYTFPFILPMGRCTAPPKAPVEGEEENDEVAEDTSEKSEKFTSTLKGDEKNAEQYPPGLPAWNFALTSGLTPKHAPVVARSLMWPGAVSVFLGTRSCNFYVGYGAKHLSGMEYTPLPPSEIQVEFNHTPPVALADGEEADPDAPPKTDSLALEQTDPTWEVEEQTREALEEEAQAAAAAAAAEDAEDN